MIKDCCADRDTEVHHYPHVEIFPTMVILITKYLNGGELCSNTLLYWKICLSVSELKLMVVVPGISRSITTDFIRTQVLRNKNLGLGEAYMEGWWDCPQLDEFICRILKAGLNARVKSVQLLRLKSLWALIFNLQSRLRSRMVAEQHYSLDNELF
jgi:hypothetical protein